MLKKFVLLLLGSILFVSNVKADYYSNWQEEVPNVDEYEKEIRYRYYKEERIGTYYTVGVDSSNLYKYEDSNDIHYASFNNWQNTCDVDSNVYDIERAYVYPYKTIQNVRFIRLTNFSSDTKIENLKIYIDNEEIDYEIRLCSNCTLDNLTNDSIVIIDTLNYYEVQTISIDISLKALNTINYQITFSMQASARTYSAIFNANSNITTYKASSNNVSGATYTSSYLYSTEVINEDFYNIVYSGQYMCRYRDIMTYRYNINKVYYDDNYYSESPSEGLVKDNEDYKTYYRYLVIEDNTDKEYNEQIDNTHNYSDLGDNEINNYSNYKDNDVDNNSNHEDNKSDQIEERTDNLIIEKDDLDIDLNNDIENNHKSNLTINKNSDIVNTLKIKNNVSISKVLMLTILGLLFITLMLIKIKRKLSIEKDN